MHKLHKCSLFIAKQSGCNRETTKKRGETTYFTPESVSHALNSGTRAFDTMIFSGVSVVRLSASRLPNHTEISLTASRATMN